MRRRRSNPRMSRPARVGVNSVVTQPLVLREFVQECIPRGEQVSRRPLRGVMACQGRDGTGL
jgi:hypothetical protein